MEWKTQTQDAALQYFRAAGGYTWHFKMLHRNGAVYLKDGMHLKIAAPKTKTFLGYMSMPYKHTNACLNERARAQRDRVTVRHAEAVDPHLAAPREAPQQPLAGDRTPAELHVQTRPGCAGGDDTDGGGIDRCKRQIERDSCIE